ncbi:hypothetical protein THAOC_19189, partial [Thalassiosira oceanica]
LTRPARPAVRPAGPAPSLEPVTAFPGLAPSLLELALLDPDAARPTLPVRSSVWTAPPASDGGRGDPPGGTVAALAQARRAGLAVAPLAEPVAPPLATGPDLPRGRRRQAAEVRRLAARPAAVAVRNDRGHPELDHGPLASAVAAPAVAAGGRPVAVRAGRGALPALPAAAVAAALRHHPSSVAMGCLFSSINGSTIDFVFDGLPLAKKSFRLCLPVFPSALLRESREVQSYPPTDGGGCVRQEQMAQGGDLRGEKIRQMAKVSRNGLSGGG